MIRKAVGAIITYQNQFILVHKVKISDLEGVSLDNDGIWDFVKGGIKDSEQDLTKALLRELNEETGSIEYQIRKQYDEKLFFTFPEKVKQLGGFSGQVTTMFLVEYTGSLNKLKPLDPEIDKIKIFSKDKVIEKLAHIETRNYFKKYFL